MINFGRAVKALNDVDVLYGALVSNEDYATVLQGRGLLMPDLPAYSEADAGSAWWYAATYEIGVGQLAKASPLSIVLRDSEPGGVLYMDIESARDYALKILAACEYAEKSGKK